MQLVTPQTSSHWYMPDGTPMHTVPMKTDPSKTRDVNLGDARKLGLFPSVTNIIRILEKPQLNSWKEEQMVMAALTLPPVEGETIDERAKRVVRDAQQQVDDARKRGHFLHSACEMYLQTGEPRPHDSVAELFAPFPDWAAKNISEVAYTEKTLVGDGYAGTTDLKADIRGYGWRICDFKSRKPYNGKIRTYDEDGMQLAAYAHADLRDHGNILPEGVMSIFINSTAPEYPTVHDWAQDDQERYWGAFLHCFGLWTLLKNYNPSSK